MELSESETASKSKVPEPRPQRDWFGSLIGIMVFLGGVSLLAMTFKLAFEMFTVPKETALNIQVKPGGKGELDFVTAGNSLGTILVRILLLVVMALVGSWISNRGITLYASSRAFPHGKSSEKL